MGVANNEIKTFAISENGEAITCFFCRRTSHNLNDVTQRYCGYCNTFHDDAMRALRLFRMAFEESGDKSRRTKTGNAQRSLNHEQARRVEAQLREMTPEQRKAVAEETARLMRIVFAAPKTASEGSAHLVDCNAYWQEPLEYKTISEALADNRIVSVTKEEDGRFRVEEMCDQCFAGYLTREQLIAWAHELRAMAGRCATSRRTPGALQKRE
jgi:hypothetical protein